MTDEPLSSGGRAPLVSELFDRLAREWPAHARNRSALFQIALQVCTEELRLTKRGNPPASMDILVERAKLILTGATRPPADLPPPLGDLPEAFGDGLDTPFDGGSELPPHLAADGPFRFDVGGSPVPAAPALTFEEILARQEQLEAEDLAIRQATRRRPSPMLVGALLAAALLAIAAVGLFLVPRNTPPPGVDRVVASALPAEPKAEVVPTDALVEPTVVSLQPTPLPQPTSTPRPEPAGPPTPTVVRPQPPTRSSATPATSELPEPVPARPQMTRRVPAMTSIDWRGKEPAYVIHFSSYRDRAPAAADARRLEAEHSRPAFAVAVELGPDGHWWRVILAGFPDAESAVAYRDDLLARHTPELGHVFRIESP